MTASSHPGPPGRLPPDELLLGDIVRPLVERWRLVVGVPVAAALIGLLLALVWPKSYTAQASFTPEQPSAGGGSSAIANALGSVGGLGSLMGSIGGVPTALAGGGATSPDFFAGILKSRELLTTTLTSAFDAPGEAGQQRALLELLRPHGSTPARRLGTALRKLEKKAVVSVDRRTGIVTLKVTMPDPELAAAVANRMTELLNKYNLERRQFSSRAQRRFIAGRLAQAEQELRASERMQSAFLLQNRSFGGSPRLEEQAVRMSREIRVQQEIVLGLRKSFEDARIAEVRDTPVLTIVDHAAPPDRPVSPQPLLWMAVSGVLAAFGVLVYTFATAAAARRVAADHGAGTRAPTRHTPQRGVLGAVDPPPHGEPWSPASHA